MHSSLLKDTMKRKQPPFSESSYGYRSFTQLLEDAEKLGFIALQEGPALRHLRRRGLPAS